jgi:hypothetical protein
MSGRGTIIPEDPRTGVALLEDAYEFDVLTRVSGRQMSRPSADHPYEITKKPSSDHRLEALDTAQLEGWYSDIGELSHGPTLENPLQLGIGLKGRSEEMAAELEEFFRRVDLVTVSCPGLAVRGWAITDLNCEPQPDVAAVRVTMSIKEQRVVELEERQSVVDADVEAIGGGGVFNAGEM